MLRSRALIASACLTTLLLYDSPVAHSQPQPSASASSSPAELDPQLQQAVLRLVKKVEEYGGTAGVHVIDLSTGRELATHAAGSPFNPASNMKVVTAAAALWKLGPAHTFHTALYGRQSGTVLSGVVLRSYGDPSLTTKDLWELTHGLRRSGIRKIDGDVLVDQSYFDAQHVPPGFDQQPGEWAYFRAPVSAVALDRNTVTMHVAPTRSGDPAWVTFEPGGFVDMRGRVRTAGGGTAQSVSLRLQPEGFRIVADIGGSIPEDSSRLRIAQRVDDPTLFAGYALHAILSEQGIEVTGKVRAGGETARHRLTLHESEPLGSLLQRLGKDSDNFYAEMIFKGLDAGKKRRGLSSEDGAGVVRAYLEHAGAWDAGIVIKNGSGLFDTNRLTPRAITKVLRAAYDDEKMRPEFVAHLAVGGEDGTLRWRFRDRESRGRVRAKTGTLASVASLSGYVMRPGTRSPIAFAVLVNGVDGKVPGARVAIDQLVKTIARESR